jgi:hypothetical protein
VALCRAVSPDPSDIKIFNGVFFPATAQTNRSPASVTSYRRIYLDKDPAGRGGNYVKAFGHCVVHWSSDLVVSGGLPIRERLPTSGPGRRMIIWRVGRERPATPASKLAPPRRLVPWAACDSAAVSAKSGS